MASTIDNLYLKYANRVQRYLENDGYYQYLLELIQSGKTTVTQINRVLDKTVDERWISAIEDAIPAIHEIIAHPRKFLKTTESVVPVEKAKKVGPDSVRHLASHTQYITGMRGGMVYPGKILTVETDESVDLYENRFVNTLIHKLSEFIEKRTGALFWDTGDEELSVLRMESTVEDDYETIEYKLDMTVKNKQTYLENDLGKIEVFKRIDRLRRMVADFRSSTFCAMMAETAPVRPPIQRTNQLTKNPEYRKCYDLWMFLERYDQVGYTIDVRETALDFDEDYLFQMYGNLALNYTVFKSLLEHDQRRVTEQPKRRREVKPKFVRQIVEEFVDDYDIPDVEIRRVIVEEVTKAQLEIERRTREQEAKRAAQEAEREKKRLEREQEKEKERAAREAEREKARLAAEQEKAAEKARLAAEKEKERLAAQKAKEAEKARLAKEKEREKAKAAAQKAKEAEKARLAKEKEREKAKAAAQKAKEAEKARLAREKEREKAKAAAQKAKEAEKARLAKEQERQKAPASPGKSGTGAKAGNAGQKKSAPATRKSAVPRKSAEEPAPPVPVAEASVPEPGKTAASSAAGPPEAAAPEDRPETMERVIVQPEEPAAPAAEPAPDTRTAEAASGAESPLPETTVPPRPEPTAPAEPPVPGAETQPPAPEQHKTEPESTGNPLLDWVRRRRQRARERGER